MNKKLFILGAVALLSVSAHAQHPLKIAKHATDAMACEVNSRFSKNVPLTVINTKKLGDRVIGAQFAATSKTYISSAQLFKQVQQNNGLKNLEPADLKLLEAKFDKLDEIVRLQTAAFSGYRGALLSERPALRENIMMDVQINGMLNVLDVQHYMQLHNNEFPQLFTVTSNGWLLATDVWTSREGTETFRQVLDILIKEQSGQVSPAVVEQLTALCAKASNALPMQTVAELLQNWRIARNEPTQAPQLPTDLGAAYSLRGSNAENLWLSVQIRLLQLTPGLELPQILKEAKVTQ